MRASRLAPLWIAGLVAVSAAACSEYHYYDIDVTFDIAAGQFAGTNEISTIQRCEMIVSGADNGYIAMGLTENCPPMTAAGIGTHVGIVEFSTFKDSGNLMFTFNAYDDSTLTPACKTGSGTKTIAAKADTTVMDTLLVEKIAPGCVTP